MKVNIDGSWRRVVVMNCSVPYAECTYLVLIGDELARWHSLSHGFEESRAQVLDALVQLADGTLPPPRYQVPLVRLVTQDKCDTREVEDYMKVGTTGRLAVDVGELISRESVRWMGKEKTDAA